MHQTSHIQDLPEEYVSKKKKYTTYTPKKQQNKANKLSNPKVRSARHWKKGKKTPSLISTLDYKKNIFNQHFNTFSIRVQTQV